MLAFSFPNYKDLTKYAGIWKVKHIPVTSMSHRPVPPMKKSLPGIIYYI